MNIAIISILLLMSIVLIVLIIKEHLEYKKEKEFHNAHSREFNSRLKDELEMSEE